MKPTANSQRKEGDRHVNPDMSLLMPRCDRVDSSNTDSISPASLALAQQLSSSSCRSILERCEALFSEEQHITRHLPPISFNIDYRFESEQFINAALLSYCSTIQIKTRLDRFLFCLASVILTKLEIKSFLGAKAKERKD